MLRRAQASGQRIVRSDLLHEQRELIEQQGQFIVESAGHRGREARRPWVTRIIHSSMLVRELRQAGTLW